MREKADIKAKLEEARQRRLLIENSRFRMFVYLLITLFIIKLSFFLILRQKCLSSRLSKNLEDAAPTQNFLLVE